MQYCPNFNLWLHDSFKYFCRDLPLKLLTVDEQRQDGLNCSARRGPCVRALHKTLPKIVQLVGKRRGLVLCCGATAANSFGTILNGTLLFANCAIRAIMRHMDLMSVTS